jgi:hypothetical protein
MSPSREVRDGREFHAVLKQRRVNVHVCVCVCAHVSVHTRGRERERTSLDSVVLNYERLGLLISAEGTCQICVRACG